MALRIMRLNEVKAVTGLSKTTIYRFEKEGRFPSRVSLGERSMGWFEDEINLWLTQRIAARRSDYHADS